MEGKKSIPRSYRKPFSFFFPFSFSLNGMEHPIHPFNSNGITSINSDFTGTDAGEKLFHSFPSPKEFFFFSDLNSCGRNRKINNLEMKKRNVCTDQ